MSLNIFHHAFKLFDVLYVDWAFVAFGIYDYAPACDMVVARVDENINLAFGAAQVSGQLGVRDDSCIVRRLVSHEFGNEPFVDAPIGHFQKLV
jgi:hypothetical protein